MKLKTEQLAHLCLCSCNKIFQFRYLVINTQSIPLLNGIMGSLLLSFHWPSIHLHLTKSIYRQLVRCPLNHVYWNVSYDCTSTRNNVLNRLNSCGFGNMLRIYPYRRWHWSWTSLDLYGRWCLDVGRWWTDLYGRRWRGTCDGYRTGDLCWRSNIGDLNLGPATTALKLALQLQQLKWTDLFVVIQYYYGYIEPTRKERGLSGPVTQILY